MSARIAVATAVAKNYLPFARVLADSLLARHPDLPLFVALADEVDGYFHPETERFRVVPLSLLPIPALPRFLFRYSRQEVVPAVKPFLISWLLESGYDAVLFLDADILVLDSLDPLLAAIAAAPLTLTPHFLRPATGPSAAARERNVLQCGVYNGGFLGASAAPATRRFLAWWQERLLHHCRYEPAAGTHFDQRWLDFAPSFVPEAAVLRDPVYNVAYWNLPERPVEAEAGIYRTGGRPVAFFHFSGFEPAQPQAVTRYWPEKRIEEFGAVAPLFAHYRELLYAAGYGATASWPYAYDFYANRARIPAVARAAYASLGEAAERFGDPREVGSADSFYRWLQEPAGADDPLPRLWRLLYGARQDLREAFPEVPGPDTAALLAWIAEYGDAALELCGAGPAARPLTAWELLWQRARDRERSAAALRFREVEEAARVRGEHLEEFARLLRERDTALLEMTHAAEQRLALLEKADSLLQEQIALRTPPAHHSK